MITYPVDVDNDRFSIREGAEIKRNRRWPREDGGPIQGPQPDAIMLETTIAPETPHDPATQNYVGVWTDNEADQSTTFQLVNSAKTQEEIDAYANEQQLVQYKSDLAAAITWVQNSYATIEGLPAATNGNVNSQMDGMKSFMATFLRNFEKFLKLQRVDE